MTNECSLPLMSRPAVGSSIYGKRIRIGDGILTTLIYLCAACAIGLLAGIVGYVFWQGIPNLSWSFLTTVSSAVKGTTGILGNIVNTLYIVGITLLLATPLGIGAAIYLNEYAKPGRVVRMIEFTTETLAGIPSILYGLFGMVFFGMALGFKYSILTGSFTLTLMILPLITRTTQEALKTVPDTYRSGALGIGATKWYMIRTILLPSAMPGVLTGVILSVGRMVGESAALLFTAGSGYYMPKNWLTKPMEPGGTLTIQMYLFMQKAKYKEAFAIAVVLLVIVLGINGLAKYLSGRFNAEKQ